MPSLNQRGLIVIVTDNHIKPKTDTGLAQDLFGVFIVIACLCGPYTLQHAMPTIAPVEALFEWWANEYLYVKALKCTIKREN